MKPLLAHTYEPFRATFPCYVQPKFNGVRALYQSGFFQSRDELPWNPGILDHIRAELLELFPTPVILDGELYVHGWPLQRINGAVTPVRQSIKADTHLVEYHVFDTVHYHKSFEERWNSLPLGAALRRVRFAQSKLVHSLNEADAFYKEMVDLGYEGIMYRLDGCPYTQPHQETVNGKGPPGRLRLWSDQDNRVWHLLKRKNWQDGEYLCTGFCLTVGEKGETGFQMILQTPQGRFFNVSSGLSDSERDYYAANPPIDHYVEVEYLCLSIDLIPQNTTIKRVL